MESNISLDLNIDYYHTTFQENNKNEVRQEKLRRILELNK
jgi:hypothetical protein